MTINFMPNGNLKLIDKCKKIHKKKLLKFFSKVVLSPDRYNQMQTI